MKRFRRILDELSKNYEVKWQILNSNGWVPQYRPRLCIIGFRRPNKYASRFEFPNEAQAMQSRLPLPSLLDFSLPWQHVPETLVLTRNRKCGEVALKTKPDGSIAIVAMTAPPTRPSVGIQCCPCVTRTRADNALWLCQKIKPGELKWRVLDVDDLGKLQGVPAHLMTKFKQRLPPRVLRQALGNAMTFPVAEAILMKLLPLLN